MRKLMTSLLCGLLLTGTTSAQSPADSARNRLTDGESREAHPVKYAIYSSAWALSSNAGLRIVAHNRSQQAMELDRIVFGNGEEPVELDLGLDVPAGSWAETQTGYRDLLTGNECVSDTLEQNWLLVEISNYNLNPSVRGLIIRDTNTFRIYQCVRDVQVSWTDPRGETHSEEQWVMYHFERPPR